MRTANVTCERRRRNYLWAGKITLRIARAHAPFEIAIRCRDADLARLEQSYTEADAGATTSRKRVGARVKQNLPDPAFLGFLLYPFTGGAQIEFHAWSDLFPLQNFCRRFEVVQP